MQMVNSVLKNFESPINGEMRQPFAGEATKETPPWFERDKNAKMFLDQDKPFSLSRSFLG